MTTSTQVSSRYVTALIELAEEAKILEKIEKDLGDLRSMIAESADLAQLIHSPLIGATQQDNALNALADKAKFQDLTKNFLGVLSVNRRLGSLEDIIEAFYAELSSRRGEITVNVQTAQDLSAKQKKDLEDAIAKSVGSDVTLKMSVEPSILGGMIVTVGSHMVDDSVTRKLERLQAAMSRQSNQNTNENIVEEKERA